MQIFHVALQRDWDTAVAAGEYLVSTLGASLADVGFIHFSGSTEQTAGVVSRYYAGVTEPLVLLTVDTDILDARGARWLHEPAGAAGELFPHVYGPLLVADVVEVWPCEVVAGSLSGRDPRYTCTFE